MKQKKLFVTTIFLLLFTKVTYATCGLSAYYSIQGSVVWLFPSPTNPTYNISINSGDSVIMHINKTGGSGCICTMDSVYWTYNGNVVSVDSNSCLYSSNYLALTAGLYVVHFIWDYWMVEHTITFNISHNPVSVAAIDFQNILSVQPNPFSGRLFITLQKSDVKQITIFLRNLLGQAVYSSIDKNTAIVYKKEIDLRHLQKGVYFLEVKMDEGRLVRKMVKE